MVVNEVGGHLYVDRSREKGKRGGMERLVTSYASWNRYPLNIRHGYLPSPTSVTDICCHHWRPDQRFHLSTYPSLMLISNDMHPNEMLEPYIQCNKHFSQI